MISLPNDPKKRWFVYGVIAIVAVIFGKDAASILLNAIAMGAPAV